MRVSVMVPGKIRKVFLDTILGMYEKGELSASRASQMLGIPRAAFYKLLAETDIRLPRRLNDSIMRELKSSGG